MDNKYKSANRLNLSGVIALIVGILVSGIILSIVYLVLNKLIPFIYLNCVLAGLLGFGVGKVGAWVVKHFKLTNTVIVLVISMICGIIFQYVKWSIYVNWDYQKYAFEETDATAYEYYKLEYDFNDSYIQGDIKNHILTMQTLSFAEYTGEEYLEYLQSTYDYTSDEIEKMHNVSYYKYCKYDTILGSDVDTAVINLDKTKQMEVSEYIREVNPKLYPSLVYLLCHPDDLVRGILNISEEGRWTLSSRRDPLLGMPVNGIALIVIWMCEFILILGVMLGIIRSQVIRPFIEHENEWAIHDTAHSILLAAGDYDDEELNDNIRRNIHCLLDLPALQQVESTCYYAIEVYRSEDLRENYIRVFLHHKKEKNKESKKRITNYVRVERSFVERMYKHCEESSAA